MDNTLELQQRLREEKCLKYFAAGLTEQEVDLLTAPLSRLTPEYRIEAMKALDKYRIFVKTDNEEKRKVDTENRNNLPFDERISFVARTTETK